MRWIIDFDGAAKASPPLPPGGALASALCSSDACFVSGGRVARALRMAAGSSMLRAMPIVQLVNPNTSTATTNMMLARAREVAPAGLALEGVTAEFGAALIIDPETLAVAADAVAALAPRLVGHGVIVAAFGDPGADRLAACLSVPVIGIGEAAIRAAGHNGRPFSIVTTTPRLEASIRGQVDKLGFGKGLASLRITIPDPVTLTADAPRLEAALRELAEECVDRDRAEAIIVGGGPLAIAARTIASTIKVEIIEPIPAAVAAMARMLGIAG